MAPRIEVIIPTVHIDNALRLVREIEKNRLLPKRVIIINNSLYQFNYRSSFFKIKVLRTRSGHVNESLDLGRVSVADGCRYVALLNDDIFIGDWFFKRVMKTFEEAGDECSAVCPLTVPETEPLVKRQFGISRLITREGWAPTFKREFLDNAPPIPRTVKTFHGDDWFWIYTTTQIGKRWFKDKGNTIRHIGGATTRPLGFRAVKKTEYNAFKKVLIDIYPELTPGSRSYIRKRFGITEKE